MKENMLSFRIIMYLIICLLFLTSACIRSRTNDIKEANNLETNTESGKVAAEHPKEYLVVWGRESGLSGDCHVIVIDLQSLDESESHLPLRRCNFSLAMIEGLPYLMNVNNELHLNHSELSLFAVTSNGDVRLTSFWQFSGVEITSRPQWHSSETFYFSGIVEGDELIFKVDADSGEYQPFVALAGNGFATNPRINGGGTFLAYEVWERHSSRNDCDRQTCNYNYSHIIELDTMETISVNELLVRAEPGFPKVLHCRNTWSPDSRWLAIDIGCSFERPGRIAIVDTHIKSLAALIVSSDPQAVFGPYQWTDDGRLITEGKIEISAGESFAGYFSFSPVSQLFELWPHMIDSSTNYDSRFIYDDWTNNGSYALGQTVIPGDVRQLNLFISNTDDPQAATFKLHLNEAYVAWQEFSESGQRFAFISVVPEEVRLNDWLYIYDLNGIAIYDREINLVEYDAAWMILRFE